MSSLEESAAKLGGRVEDGRITLSCGAVVSLDEDSYRIYGIGSRPWPQVRRLVESRLKIRPPEQTDPVESFQKALKLWKRTRAAAGTPVERYLLNRGITLRPIPAAIRFAECWHEPYGYALPTMVSEFVHVSEKFAGVHRTFLDERGPKGKAVEKAKTMLGKPSFIVTSRFRHGCQEWTAEKSGGSAAVRLHDGETSRIGISEGIEDALTVTQMTGLPCWAAMTAWGVEHVLLPELVTDIRLLADRDPVGLAHAGRAKERFEKERRKAVLALPPRPHKDFNEWLIKENDR